EYWSHAAAFLPMADYRYSLFRKQAIRSGANCWFHRDDHVMTHVLDRIRAEGPVSARDFESPGRKATSGWWEWKPAKRALEQLFLDGTLMVKERRGFQKVFDLAERVVPEGVDQTLPDRREFIRWKIMQTVKSLGVAESGDFSYGFPNMKTDLEAELKELVAEGRIVRCRVEGERERAGFVLSGSVERFGPIRYDNRMRILSPFDNLVIRRIRFRRLFGRDYQVECYVPASKRRYGYFALPILWRDQCVGLIDCKAHRASRSLEIRRFSGWDSEPIAVPAKRTQEALEAFAEFNGCTRIDNASDKD
ncbi:YcaQ family DNA glycosylase, partial [bacterium]|nr:YcaQ family DNA glycosylase [candidate division CSSED10-310 bacterium]